MLTNSSQPSPTQDYANLLSSRAVAYLNVDVAVEGKHCFVYCLIVFNCAQCFKDFQALVTSHSRLARQETHFLNIIK